MDRVVAYGCLLVHSKSQKSTIQVDNHGAMFGHRVFYRNAIGGANSIQIEIVNIEVSNNSIPRNKFHKY